MLNTTPPPRIKKKNTQYFHQEQVLAGHDAHILVCPVHQMLPHNTQLAIHKDVHFYLHLSRITHQFKAPTRANTIHQQSIPFFPCFNRLIYNVSMIEQEIESSIEERQNLKFRQSFERSVQAGKNGEEAKSEYHLILFHDKRNF